MDKVRLGIIGIGNMGSGHAKNILAGKIEGGILTAVCDIDPAKQAMAKEKFGDGVEVFSNADDFFAKAPIDAVIVATPHYFHPPLAIQGFNAGKHVLVEKPAGVYTKQVKEMNEVAVKSGKIFSMMFNQRTNPVYIKVKDMIANGELGEIRRTNWIITNWYRSQSYYNSGGWRATWAGEGGGVLANQDPHQLDLWQWMCGMPVRVRAFMEFGKMHDIEVEDDVTAYVEYENGATGLFVTSTYESPGTNRLEISGDMGKIVVEDGKITFYRNRVSERKFNAEFTGGFGSPEVWKCDIPVTGVETAHIGVLSNFCSAILNGTPLMAPGVEGIKGLSLSNAMHLSAWTGDFVEPANIDEELYIKLLNERIATSTYVKPETSAKVLDTAGTY